MNFKDDISSIPIDNLKDNFDLTSMHCFFPSDYILTLDNAAFAFINTQRSNMQSEHWIMVANSSQSVFCTLSRSIQLLQAAVQLDDARANTVTPHWFRFLHDSYYHFFKFQQEQKTAVHDVNVPSFIHKYLHVTC